MRDEVLIKRPLVTMVTWILANKRVGEKCLLGDGERGGNGDRRDRARRAVPGRDHQAQRFHLVSLPASRQTLR